MADILFIKTSSLGDVIHHMPALSEARRMRPDARFSWAVEEAYAPLARLHPAVDEVIATASRRWRGALFSPSTLSNVAGFVRRLRLRAYDQVIDTQGLFRSALIARLARGQRHGFDRDSVRERPAAALYNLTHKVPRDLHAVARNRLLTGLALGYRPEGPPDYGLDRAALRRGDAAPYAILLHATARAEKEWPEANWIALATALRQRGVDVVLPWGEPRERARSERIAASVPGATAPDRRPLDEVARLIAGATLVVGVDTGLLHLAAALGVPLIGIFSATRPGLTGPVGAGPMAVIDGAGAVPDLAEVFAALDRLSW